MQNFTIIKKNDIYKIICSDSFSNGLGPIDLPPEYLSAIQAIDSYLDTLKTPQELAFNFVKTYATDEEKLQMIAVYPNHRIGFTYLVGDEFKLENQLYRVIQAHTSQADWIPSELPALYLKIEPAGVVPEWVQPTGEHDDYNIGDHVMFEGQKYVSLIDANTWSPAAYPAGWELVVA